MTPDLSGCVLVSSLRLGRKGQASEPLRIEWRICVGRKPDCFNHPSNAGGLQSSGFIWAEAFAEEDQSLAVVDASQVSHRSPAAHALLFCLSW